jgi:uncharacterized protein (TIGR02453 family)
MLPGMGFSGWPVEALEFYEGLLADNSKAYWHEHKHVYDAKVYAPMAELLEELSGEFGPGRIARPYRDVRFRVDKSPYKTNIYAILEGGGYVSFSADGLFSGMGYYQMGPDQLDRYRRAVADDKSGGELVDLVAQLQAARLEVEGTQRLKTAPRGFASDHARIELLRNKNLIAWRHWPVAAWLHTAGAKRRVSEFLRTSAPLQRWLDDHVGESEEAELRAPGGRRRG